MRTQFQFILKTVLVPAGLGAGAGWACSVAAGATLGLVLGPLVFVALSVPPLVASCATRRESVSVVVAFFLALLVWPILMFHDARVALWGLLLLAFALGVAGLVRGLMTLRVSDFFASAFGTVVALAWLSWPVWLAPQLSGSRGESVVGWMVAAHPLFATNALFIKLGVWTEMGTAYRLTNLNQDVAYALPNGPWACIILHATLALVLAVRPQAESEARL